VVISTNQPDRLYYYKKYLRISGEDPAQGSEGVLKTPLKPVTLPAQNKLGRFVKYLLITLFRLPKVLVELSTLPRDCLVIFNHTKRVRKGTSGSTYLYIERLAAKGSQFILIDECPTTVEIPPHASVFHRDKIEDIAIIIAAFNRFFHRILRKSYNSIESDFMVRVFLWQFIFQYIKPARIVTVVFYGKEWAIAAAKRRGIEVLDIQHGVMFEEHPIYNITDGLRIPHSEFVLPNACWVYGEYWRQRLLNSGWKPEQVQIIGYYLDIGSKQDCSKYSPYLFYPSPVGEWKVIVNHIASIKSEAKRRGFKIIISPHPHPAEKISNYNEVLDETVLMVSEIDSYDLLRNCHAIINTNSTILFEAMLFNKCAFAIDYEAQPNFVSDLIQAGFTQPIKMGEFPELFNLSSSNRKFFFEDVNWNMLGLAN
jgi:hypothetical protein